MTMMPSESEVVLSVRDLDTVISTKMGSFSAVDRVSFDVRRGETLGIVGESGSGKSMTGLSLLRLLPRHAASIVGGSVKLGETELLDLSEPEMRKIRGREIAMILQDPQTSLNPAFTVGDQIMEALRLHRKPGKGGYLAMAVEALRKVRVAAPEMRVSAYPHQMSGGMRQRVVGAIAISCRPQIIIADEPTTSLDVTVQAQYLRLLRELQEETGLSIIFITHDFGIVARVCHRLAVMYAGQIVETGPVRQIFERPSHPYTEALLASVPRLHRQTGRLPSITGQPPALWNKPKGCRFAPRCPYADARCHAVEPPVFDLGGTGVMQHSARCWRLQP
jgi:oligopeptide/dipeptide ABC transporter ATP-binding protein